MSEDKSPKHPLLEESNADTVYYADPESVPGNPMPPKRLSSFSNKKAASIFFLIVVFLVSNELVFDRAKHRGISTKSYPYKSPDIATTGYPRPIAMNFDADDNLWVIGSKFSPAPVAKWSYLVTELKADGSTKSYKSGWGEVTSLAVDSENQVWFAGDFGLRRLTEQGNWIPVWDNALEDKHVYALAADSQGQLWLATRNNLSKYANGQWVHFPVENIKTLAIDPQGQIWSLDRDGTFCLIGVDGNPEDVVLPIDALSFTIDARRNLWARVGDGVAVCSTDTSQCTVYRRYNSVIAPAATRPVMAFDSANRLWIPYSTFASTIRFYVIDVEQLVPVGILNVLVISRLVLRIFLSLAVYFFIVRFFDARNKLNLPDILTHQNILKKMRVTLILFGVFSPALALATVWVFTRPDIFILEPITILFIGSIGALITLVRLGSFLTLGIQISNKEIALSVLWGSLIAIGVLCLSFYTIFRLVAMMLIGY